MISKNRRRRAAHRFLQALSAVMAAVMLTMGMLTAMPTVPMTAHAVTKDELDAKLAELEEKLARDQADLEQAKKNKAEAAKAKAALESAIATIRQQIAVIAESIVQVQAAIEAKEAEIAATEEAITIKQGEILQQQNEIDEHWDEFKQRVAAMQEMRDSGTMSLLSAMSNLYQFLTFTEVLQDVSNKDTEVLDNMQAQLDALAQAKAELEEQQALLETQMAELEAQKAELDAQRQQLETKKAALAASLAEAARLYNDAAAAVEDAQDAVDNDLIDYNALMAQIQAQIGDVAGQHSDLSFVGFICPLHSYTRVSSGYGTRVDPMTGKSTKMHYGQDWAAPEGTTIYAAASGYVVQASVGKNGGYGNMVLIYHGSMGDGSTYSTLYAHMSGAPSVSVGSYVAQGTPIGKVGHTGNSTGNHLHLEVWQGSSVANTTANKATRVNPANYVPLH